jgi:hypothetical protein
MLLHWAADFVLQSDRVALSKSEKNSVLGEHCIIYSLPMAFPFLAFGFTAAAVAFSTLLLSHFVIDYVTARLNKKFWLNNKRHEFFVMVGFDQFLHIGVILYLALTFWRI